VPGQLQQQLGTPSLLALTWHVVGQHLWLVLLLLPQPSSRLLHSRHQRRRQLRQVQVQQQQLL
jgi:uncharacterized membrane protein YdcZ (DUF606 family)